MVNPPNTTPIDFELEAQLKKYIARKAEIKALEKGMVQDFSETEDDIITVSQTFASNELEIEEDDE